EYSHAFRFNVRTVHVEMDSVCNKLSLGHNRIKHIHRSTVRYFKIFEDDWIVYVTDTGALNPRRLQTTMRHGENTVLVNVNFKLIIFISHGNVMPFAEIVFI